MSEDHNVSEILLSISGPEQAITEIHTLITEYQEATGAEDPAVFAALLPIQGDTQEEKIGWCQKHWQIEWDNAHEVPDHLLGDRGTEFNLHEEGDTVSFVFFVPAGCPTEAVRQISQKWPKVWVMAGWDDPTNRTIGTMMYNKGVRTGFHTLTDGDYPAPPVMPDDNATPDEIYEAVEQWLGVRGQYLAESARQAMGLARMASKDDMPQDDDEPYERPVHATGVPSEENFGEFIIAEVQNGKYSATIVTVPPTALSGSDHIEIFPTMSKYRVLAGVSTEWFDRLICEANGWDYDSDDTPEMSDDELDNHPGMQEAINKIMAESMVRIAVYFKAKGLTI